MSVMFVFLFFFFCPRNATAVLANVGHAGNVWLAWRNQNIFCLLINTLFDGTCVMSNF